MILISSSDDGPCSELDGHHRAPQRQDRGEFLFGKTVGLVGLGRVGSHVARRLVNWDVRLLAADPYVPQLVAQDLGATLVDLPTLLTESDVVSLHASLTDDGSSWIRLPILRGSVVM